MPIFRVKSVQIYTGQKNLQGYTRGSRNKYQVWLHVYLREVKNNLFSFKHSYQRDCSKNFNIRTCEHMILGQLRIWARQTTYAALIEW